MHAIRPTPTVALRLALAASGVGLLVAGMLVPSQTASAVTPAAGTQLSASKHTATMKHKRAQSAARTSTATPTAKVSAAQATTTSAAPASYVSATGSDQNSGSASSPWRTIQWAADHTTTNKVIVGRGNFTGFTVTRPSLTIIGAGQGLTIVGPQPGVSDNIKINASGTTLRDVTVSGCVPLNIASGGYEWSGSGNIGLYNGGSNATITNVSIAGAPATNSFGLDFGCFGVVARGVTGTTVSDSTITGTGYAVYILTEGSGDVITNNSIHDNNVMIRNTPTAGDDFGGGGVEIVNANPARPIEVTHNTLYNNFASSHDYGTDGGAFEIYASYNVVFDSNTAYNNDDLLETGSGPGGGCGKLTVTNNIFSGLTAGSTLARSPGMIFRCAANSTVSNNTITNVSWWAFWFTPRADNPNEADNLVIANNTIKQQSNGYVFSLSANPQGHNLQISRNTFSYYTFALGWQKNQFKTYNDFAASSNTAVSANTVR